MLAAVCVVLALAIALPLTAYLSVRRMLPAAAEETLPACDLSCPWYEQYSVITHALGTVKGRMHTNSREAFIETYGRGARVFEADFCFSSDGELIVRHDFTDTSYWNLEQQNVGVMSHETFMNTPICTYFTSLDVNGLFELMREYPDTYLVTDIKYEEGEESEQIFRKFTETLAAEENADLRERVIIQIYGYDMYEWVRGAVPESNYILTLYMMKNRDFDKIGRFCRDNGIPVVAINETILTEECVSTLHGYGVTVYTHTINKMSEMKKRTRLTGVDGFYSDCVTDPELMGAGFERQ